MNRPEHIKPRMFFILFCDYSVEISQKIKRKKTI